VIVHGHSGDNPAHSHTVHVKRPGVTLRSRTGYAVDDPDDPSQL
jgi:hypothetical protein